MENALIYPKTVDNPLLPFLTLHTGSESKADPKCSSWWVIWGVFTGSGQNQLSQEQGKGKEKGRAQLCCSLHPSLKLSRPVCVSKSQNVPRRGGLGLNERGCRRKQSAFIAQDGNCWMNSRCAAWLGRSLIPGEMFVPTQPGDRGRGQTEHRLHIKILLLPLSTPQAAAEQPQFAPVFPSRCRRWELLQVSAWGPPG